MVEQFCRLSPFLEPHLYREPSELSGLVTLGFPQDCDLELCAVFLGFLENSFSPGAFLLTPSLQCSSSDLEVSSCGLEVSSNSVTLNVPPRACDLGIFSCDLSPCVMWSYFLQSCDLDSTVTLRFSMNL